MALETRGLTADDAGAFTASAERAIAAGELLGSSIPHGERLVEWALLEPQHVGVAELDGAFAGWVQPEAKVLVVEPSFRRQGVGTALVELGLRMEAGRSRPNLLLGAVPDEEPAHAFLSATAFGLHSLLWDLELPAGVAVAEPGWPDGITARSIRYATESHAFARLFNAAFADHATPLQIPEDTVQEPPPEDPWKPEDV